MIACAEPNALGRTQLSPTTSAPRSTKPSPPFSPFPSQTRWTITLDAEIAGPPAFDGSTAYLSLEGDRLGAYDLTTGKLRWDASARPQTTPVTGDGLLFIEQADRLVALRSDNGSVAWEAPVSEQRAAPLVWDHGWLVATTQKALHVFRAVDGTPLWSRDLPSPAHSTPALAGEAVYLSLEDGRVMAFHVTDGAVLWERRLGGAANGIRALEDRLLVGANDNYLYCLNSETGQVVWRSRTGADVVSLAIVADRRVYFVSLDNVLRALNLSNGVQLWKRALPFRPQWGPIKAADTLLVTGLAGPARAFFMKDGLPAGDLSVGNNVELVARPHAFDFPLAFGPIIVTVTRGLTSNATVTASSRAVEPPLISALAPLPGVVPVRVPTQR